jgi:hypothetical protein
LFSGVSITLRIIFYRTLDAVSAKNVRLNLFGNPQRTAKDFAGGAFNEGGKLREVTKEVVGIHVLLNLSLFACDILRRFLQRVSLAKPSSAPLRF